MTHFDLTPKTDSMSVQYPTCFWSHGPLWPFELTPKTDSMSIQYPTCFWSHDPLCAFDLMTHFDLTPKTDSMSTQCPACFGCYGPWWPVSLRMVHEDLRQAFDWPSERALDWPALGCGLCCRTVAIIWNLCQVTSSLCALSTHASCNGLPTV